VAPQPRRTPTSAPAGETSVQVTVSDVTGNPAFIFDTTRKRSGLRYGARSCRAAGGSLVQILELSGAGTGEIVFQAAASADGTVQGSFTVNQTTRQVTLRATIGGTDVQLGH